MIARFSCESPSTPIASNGAGVRPTRRREPGGLPGESWSGDSRSFLILAAGGSGWGKRLEHVADHPICQLQRFGDQDLLGLRPGLRIVRLVAAFFERSGCADVADVSV